MQSRNLAATAGRWSAQHRKTAILGWIVFVVLATDVAVTGITAGTKDFIDATTSRLPIVFQDGHGEKLLNFQSVGGIGPWISAVVTSAALVMVAVFGSFALGSDQVSKQIGVGLAAAILIDATLIRAVLLPATMKLLGARNWYLRKGLGWLPKFEHEPQAAPAPA